MIEQRALAALAAIGLVIMGSAAVSVGYFPASSIDLNRGRQLFEDRCAQCHNISGSVGPSFGPSLADIGAVAANRAANMTAEEFLLQSIVEPNAYRIPGHHAVMPADISSDLEPVEIISVVGYLMTAGGNPDHVHLTSLLSRIGTVVDDTQPEIDFSEVEAGKQLYLNKGKCASCHPLGNLLSDTLRGPSLLKAGNHDAAYLAESIRDPSRHIVEPYEIVTVWLKSGRSHGGRLLERNKRTIRLLVDSSDVLETLVIPTDAIESENGKLAIRTAQLSAMPAGIDKGLTDTEIEQIVKFLKELK